MADKCDKEEKLFCDHLSDMLRDVERNWTARFSFFLDERQQALASRFLARSGFHQSLLYGGYEKAGRRLLGLFPDYQEPEQTAFPIKAVTVSYRPADKPRHPDILGTLMGLNVKRELVGDILLGEEYAVIFLLEPAYTLVLNELRKIGRAGVRVEGGIPAVLPEPYTLKPIGGTVSSLRLDCLVAFFTNLSRDKASQLIRSGQVSVNFFEVEELSYSVAEGDIFSIRGYGRFVLTHVGGLSQKGRYHLLGHQYI